MTDVLTRQRDDPNGALYRLAPRYLDASSDILITTLHEYFHAVDHLYLKPRAFKLPPSFNGATPRQTSLARVKQLSLNGEMLADVAAAEVYYRMSAPADRPLVLERIRDWQAIRQLATNGFIKADGPQPAMLDSHYTAPGLQAWLDEAARRDHAARPQVRTISRPEIIAIGRAAQKIMHDALSRTTYGTLQQEATLQAATRDIMAELVSKKPTKAETDAKVRLRLLVAEPGTTPAMLARTATALHRLTDYESDPGIRARLPFDIFRTPAQPPPHLTKLAKTYQRAP